MTSTRPSDGPSPDVTVLAEEGSLRIIASRNVLVAAWRDAPTMSQLHALERVGRERGEQYPRGTALLNLALSGKPDFSADVRKETARVSALPDIFVLATAHIVLVRGLVGAAVRAFLSTSVLMARPTRPTKVFGDTLPAVDWVLARLAPAGEAWTRQGLVAVVDQG